MEARARTSTAARSSSVCPACDRPIDALRAGHVAILDGAFRYFCNAGCKSAYVDVLSKRSLLDGVMTADPPPVASGARSAEPPAVVSGFFEPSGDPDLEVTRGPYFPTVPSREPALSGIRESGDGELAESEPPPPSARSLPTVAYSDGPDDVWTKRSTEDLFPPPDEPLHVESDAREQVEPPLDELLEEGAPLTLRSRETAELDAASAETTSPRGSELAAPSVVQALASRFVAVAPMVGVFAGVLGSVVALAGERAGILQLPLALAAAVVLVGHRGLGARVEREPASWSVLVPVVVGAALAIVSSVLRDPHADVHASFVGLASASALTVDILLSRARRDVLAARVRTLRVLGAAARVVRGDAVLEVDASQVKPGEQVVVESGETIPVDGIVVGAGEAEVCPWLDSPALVRKKEGDAVVAGALVVSGKLRISATFSGAERAWLRLTQSSSRTDG
ncbi:MAG TPA: hypothetical protein VM580_15645, partial [Labilithrix sp.]|nr:hypothetical protein [Labilithrix sp.]